MDTRRSFLKKAGIFTGGTAFVHSIPPTLQKALAIDPEPGSTFYDAEHIVFLMQENRSFDHAFGTLQGVRGYNDPRAITLANKNKVWLQTNKEGDTFAPFRLDINNTKITWMGCLPHNWVNQVDAGNGGRHDKWLYAKDPGGDFKGMPLTMGHYSRADIPFYYALADAFTICDQHFCSSLTGTTPNRLFFWSGTIRSKMEAAVQANVWNEDADHNTMVSWKTYPERLEENNISWKVYQNEIYADTGLGEGQQWLDNFGDNPLEYFKQFNIKLAPEYIAYIPGRIKLHTQEIETLETSISGGTLTEAEKEKAEKKLAAAKRNLATAQEEKEIFTQQKYDALSASEKSLHTKAFANNRKDPFYHELTNVEYHDGTTTRKIDIPKGDVLQQFRQDVQTGNLPTVSWLVAPQYFSDHPDSPWFGAWYLSEAIDILTQNPEIWKKTIFVLTYDENDGYFDHVPPFGAPNPYKKNTGKVSPGIDTTVEFVKADAQSGTGKNMRESNIGLGYRVPMVIASPWTRGGFVCSEVFDHTSSLQFLEDFLEKKTGKKIREENITQWRRTVCGDLGAAFRPYTGEKIATPEFIEREPFIHQINNAQFKKTPDNFNKLTVQEIDALNKKDGLSSILPQQEKGIRSACPLPYELYVDGNMRKDKNTFEINFKAGDEVFGRKAAGAPFYVYAMNAYENELMPSRDYAIAAGGEEKDEWLLNNFDQNIYHLNVHGPNGFYRNFKGNLNDPLLTVKCAYEKKRIGKKLTGDVTFTITNNGNNELKIELKDNSYKTANRSTTILPGATVTTKVDLAKSYGWYDTSILVKDNAVFEKRFAGHVETGMVSKTDPLMGGLLG